MKKLTIIKTVIFSVGITCMSSAVAEVKDTIRVSGSADTPEWLFSNNRAMSTSAVSSAGSGKVSKTVTPNLTNALAGQISGLSVRQGNGEPGNDNASWLIRGIGSYGFGRDNECKIFVDGFEVNADYINYMLPEEIESVNILKDAAALVAFGMNGSNGIIYITTKRGQISAPTVNVKIRSSLQQPVNIYKPLNSHEYATLYNQAVSNDNGMRWSPAYDNAALEGYRNGTLPNVDWYDEVLRKHSSYSDAMVTLNGGSSMARYNVVLGYTDQSGLFNVDKTDATSNARMNRFYVRANLDMNLFKIFEAKIDVGTRLENKFGPNYSTSSLMTDLAGYPSNIYPIWDNEEQTNYSGTALYPNNPYASVHGLGWQSSRARVTQANFRLKEKLDFITPGLWMEEAFSFYSRSLSTYNKTRNYARWHNGEMTTTDQNTSIVASGYGSAGMLDWKQFRLSVGYDRNFGDHGVTAAVGFHTSDKKSDGVFGYKVRYANLSGRFNYNYQNKYIAEIGFSEFGSDAFAPAKRWEFYSAVSAAWVISKESFMKDCDWVNLLKLRASIGRTGNAESGSESNVNGYDSYGRYLYQQYYYWNNSFNTGNNAPYQVNSSVAPRFMANPDISAEKSLKYNVGFDATFLNHLDVSADFFIDKRSDILSIDRTVMGYYGNNYYLDNLGKMTNRGFELNASWNDRIGELGYSLNGMASFAKNTIDYMAEVPKAHSYNASTGLAYGTPMGLIAEGFYQLHDFNADGSLKADLPVPSFGKVGPGDIRYKDLDENGTIDDTDVTDMGDPYYPKLTYSFGLGADYKGFDFNILFRGSYGSSVNLMNFQTQFMAFVNNNNAHKVAQGAWAYYPEQGIDTRATATYPRLTTRSNDNNYRNSSFWMKNNDFLRIQNIEIGYDFCKSIIRSKLISQCRLYLNATNPVTWSNLLRDYDMDPESYYGYPALKSYTVGLSLTF